MGHDASYPSHQNPNPNTRKTGSSDRIVAFTSCDCWTSKSPPLTMRRVSKPILPEITHHGQSRKLLAPGSPSAPLHYSVVLRPWDNPPRRILPHQWRRAHSRQNRALVTVHVPRSGSGCRGQTHAMDGIRGSMYGYLPYICPDPNVRTLCCYTTRVAQLAVALCADDLYDVIQMRSTDRSPRASRL